MKKPLGPWADMRGSALTQGRACALGKYEDSSHDPTVEHLGCRVNKRVRAISSSGRIVRQMDRPRGVPSTGSINTGNINTGNINTGNINHRPLPLRRCPQACGTWPGRRGGTWEPAG